ncbi:PucR family transcriptional regulator [Actinomadura kijaniata]|uniref:PucR family transcriptional regulator n=1 Tax=Actinomadura kijaniata TaxID=46161 RepID=UPI003F1AAF0A
MRNRLVQELSEGETAEIVALLRAEVPGTIREAVREIEEEFPQYTRLQDPAHADFLERTVERSIAGFLELLLDQDASFDAATSFFQQVGVVETEEGLSEEVSQAAFRLGAAVSIRRLTAVAETHPSVTVTVMGQVAAAVLDYLNTIAAAVSEGHTDASARATGDMRLRRGRLVDLLVTADPQPDLIKQAADEAAWPLPQKVAAVALRRPSRPPWPGTALPPEVLVGLHLDEPCLIVPDPEGPGRHRMLRTGLREWRAAIGPPVATTDVVRSLGLARQALDLADGGVLPAGDPVVVTDHLPLLMLLRDRFLTETMVSRALAPLLESSRPRHARRLAETFLAVLEHGFNATAAADSMHIHAQTVRYRLRQLEALFGDDLHDPARRLEFHLALRAWLALNPPG